MENIVANCLRGYGNPLNRAALSSGFATELALTTEQKRAAEERYERERLIERKRERATAIVALAETLFVGNPSDLTAQEALTVATAFYDASADFWTSATE